MPQQIPTLPDWLASYMRLGHNFRSDPSGIIGAAERWTCHRCGRAALRHRQTGNVYGSATEESCRNS